MKGDRGPYIDPDGPSVWVPRMVPYLVARGVAQEAVTELGHRLRYIGKKDAELVGFARDCRCEEVCARRWGDDGETDDRTCTVAAWHFEIVEP